MPELRVCAVEGRRVFALHDDGHAPRLPVRYVGENADGTPWVGGEPVPCVVTADDRVIARYELYRAALLSGDLEMAPVKSTKGTK